MDSDHSVLVVDDDVFVLRAMSAMLERIGFAHVRTAESAAQAKNFIATTTPEVGLILTDLNMPGMDGVELLRYFDEWNYRGGIVLISGEDEQTLAMSSNLARSRGLHVLGWLRKPVRLESLASLLARHQDRTDGSGRKPQSPLVSARVLEKAIADGEIEPWFQPKIDVVTHKVVGVEALARWPKASGGPVYPDVFIPVAEASGLIDALTFGLAGKAVATSERWRQRGLDLKLALNVSMDSLCSADFPDRLVECIVGAGGSLDSIQLEVTESRLLGDLVTPLEVLLRLKLKKIRLSIDDFGTGHSNLSQLRDLPFDELKLDRGYVQGAADSPRAAAILESSVRLAKSLNMPIVAEGVETATDWQRIERLGCDQAQGYFIARPMPGEEIPDWVESWMYRRESLLGPVGR